MKVLLIDGNNSAHRCFTDKSLCARFADEQVLAIVFLRVLVSVVREFRVNRIMCAWDGARSPIRQALHPEYKAGRSEKHKEPSSKHDVIKRQSPWMADMLTKLGIIDISSEHGEADDMIYRAWEYSRRYNWDVAIMSNDSDLRQMVDRSTEIHVGKGQVPITWETFHEKWGFAPWMFPIYKALTGDRSDNIPGARGIGSVTAKSLMLMVEREDPNNMVEALASLRSVASFNRRAKKLLDPEIWNTFKLALRLIDLTLEPCPEPRVLEDLYDAVRSPFQDVETAHEMLAHAGMAELAFDLPLYARELVRLPHGT